MSVLQGTVLRIGDDELSEEPCTGRNTLAYCVWTERERVYVGDMMNEYDDCSYDCHVAVVNHVRHQIALLFENDARLAAWQ
jgi:hypothetical protein